MSISLCSNNEQLCFTFPTYKCAMAVVFGRREKAKASKKSSSETSKQPAREKPLEEEEGCLDNTYIWLYMYRYNCPFHLLRGFIAWRITPHSPTWCRSSARHQEGQRSFLRSFIWTDTAQVLRCHDELVKMKILRTPRNVTPDVLCIAMGILLLSAFLRGWWNVIYHLPRWHWLCPQRFLEN